MFQIFKFQINIYYIKLYIVLILIICFYIQNKNELPLKIVHKSIDKNLTYKHFLFNNEVHKLTNKKSLANNSFRGLYISSYEHENVQLINKIYENSIEKLIVDKEVKTKSSFYIFLKSGLHEVIISLNERILNSSANMFSDLSNLILIDFSQNFENDNLQNMREMFKNCINLETVNFDETNNFKNMKDLSYMFKNCESLTSLELPIYTSYNLENISYMFSNCSSLKSLNYKYLNTINVKDMSGLFYGCSSLISIDLSKFKTSNVMNMSYMFSNCLSLSSINIEFFEINKETDLNFIFNNCSELNTVKLPNLDSNHMREKNNMFIGCIKLLPSKIFYKQYKQMKLNDICIIGLWYGCNYGSMLTYYALHEIVKNLGYSVLMINNPFGSDKVIYDKTHPIGNVGSFYKISERKNLENLYEFNKECKSFLIGSDQLWNIDLSRSLKQFYFLGFADNNTKKLSYGTSFGKKYKGTEEEKNITKLNLERFNGISVRDELSIKILKDIFGIYNATQVCDPTLLLDYSNYLNLINKVDFNYSYEYFLAYILDPNHEIFQRLEQLSIDRKIKVIILLGFSCSRKSKSKKQLFLSTKGNIEIKINANLKEWLYFYYNAKNVFTDSYHGTIFSILFRKSFITLRNKKRGGERFTSLLTPLKLMNRLFETADCINKYDLYDNINYNIPIKELTKIKEDSYIWLQNQLETLLK